MTFTCLTNIEITNAKLSFSCRPSDNDDCLPYDADSCHPETDACGPDYDTDCMPECGPEQGY